VGGIRLAATDVTRSEEMDLEADPVDGAAGGETGTAEAGAPDERAWHVRRVLAMLAPALVFLAVREVGLLVLGWMCGRNDITMSRSLISWDGLWFLGIAQGGYDGVPDGLADAKGQFHSGETALAFFPGYPTVVRWVADAGGWLGVGLIAAALTVTTVAGVVCAFGLAKLGTIVAGGSRRAGLVLVALFAASPMAIVLSMAYSEAMFCAFAVWTLIGVLERRWVLAGICCAFAGLVRPTVAALILVVGLAALIAVVNRRDGWRPWLAGLLAPVGIIAFLAWVGVRENRWDGWFQVQRNGWETRFDGGAATWRFVLHTLSDPDYVYDLLTMASILAALVLLVIALVRRLEWPLVAYAVGVLVMNLASNGLMNSKMRLLVPAFTLLIPAAIGLARRRTSTLVLVLCGIAVASAWIGAYALTAWNYAI
jgi:hypothetical protein